MNPGASGFLLALLAAYGVFLVHTALAFGWRGVGVSPGIGPGPRRRLRFREFLIQAGMENIRLIEFIGVEVLLFALAGGIGFAVYGGGAAAMAMGAAAATLPVASARSRRRARRELARESWPRMIEEIRLQAVSLGRSIPQALMGVGLRGPQEMRPAFRVAHREWLMSTDFDRALDALKSQLADPTADAVCETLLIAHEVGGTDVDQRLRALIDDRTQDLQGRKDARSKQAGVRFARYFVLIVPFGMALIGLLIGDGRAAYEATVGQLSVLVAFALMALCWAWAGQLLKLPEERRVFTEERTAA